MLTKTRISMAALITITLAALAFAGVPQTINYQGYLKNTDGTPVTTATSIRFSLYSSNPSRNNPVWLDTRNITPQNGIYSLQLGLPKAITAPFDVPYFLGIKVEGDNEMELQPLSSVPYAQRAAVADTLNNMSALNLPTNGLAVGVNQLAVTSGKVGIGTATPTEQLEITGNLKLPTTTATTGQIRQGAGTLLHTYGYANIFAGSNAGNLTMTGGSNSVIGTYALSTNTTGSNNTATGASALRYNSTGQGNTATGSAALQFNTDGYYNTASGDGVLSSNTSGYSNTGTGKLALMYNDIGYENAAYGVMSLFENTTGYHNVAVGAFAGQDFFSLYKNTTGSNNTFLGAYAAPGTNTQLTNATAIGFRAVVSQDNSLVLGGIGTVAVNVGIGTTTPSQRLDVVGTAKATLFSGDGSGLTNVTAANVTGIVGIANGGTGATTAVNALSGLGAVSKTGDTMTGPLTIQTGSAATTGLVVQGNGKEGINLQEWQIGPEKAVASISATGVITGDGSGIRYVNAQQIGGQNLSQLDNRYASSLTQTPPVQNPRSTSTTSIDISGNVGGYSSITIGTDGLPVIAYYDFTNGDLKVAKCANAACSGGTVISTIDSTGDAGQYTSITIGTDGLPVIAYFDNTNGDLKVAKCTNAACSGTSTITTIDSTGRVGTFSSITIGSDGLPVISYYDQSNGHLKVAKCANTACSGVTSNTTIDASGLVGLFTYITTGTDGLPVISYYDITNGDLKVAKCGNAECSSSTTIATIDSSGDVGQYTSITIGTDGLPMISYYDFTNGDLKVAKCANATCSGGATTSTIDSTGDTGNFSSITIGTDGLPLISYYDATNGYLKVAKCSNAVCSGVTTITTVDSTGNVGLYSSITIGTDGLPVIAYYDFTNGDLKVAKCANQFCLNNWSRR